MEWDTSSSPTCWDWVWECFLPLSVCIQGCFGVNCNNPMFNCTNVCVQAMPPRHGFGFWFVSWHDVTSSLWSSGWMPFTQIGKKKKKFSHIAITRKSNLHHTQIGHFVTLTVIWWGVSCYTAVFTGCHFYGVHQGFLWIFPLCVDIEHTHTWHPFPVSPLL